MTIRRATAIILLPLAVAPASGQAVRRCRQWRWHLDEVFVKIGGEIH